MVAVTAMVTVAIMAEVTITDRRRSLGSARHSVRRKAMISVRKSARIIRPA
jgi:hypothetical protein